MLGVTETSGLTEERCAEYVFLIPVLLDKVKIYRAVQFHGLGVAMPQIFFESRLY